MKKLISIPAIFSVLFFSCQKEIKNSYKGAALVTQIRPACGTMEAMEKMPVKIKEQLSMSANRTAATASSLLIYLDFNGSVIYPGISGPDRSPLINSIRVCPAAPLTVSQITEIVELIRDDFSPFNITITTDETAFNAANPLFRHLCIVTTSPQVIGLPNGVGGVAPFNCNRISNTPCFAFAQAYLSQIRLFASVISHELGHTFGLEHQSLYDEDCQYNAANEYHPGFGNGILSFSPIMGAGTNEGINNWFAQTCIHSLCRTEGQDDFLLLSEVVELKTDDFPDIPSGSKTISIGLVEGILEKQNDIDFIKINFKNPDPVIITSYGNLDLKASVYNSGGHLLAIYDNPNGLNVSIPSANGMRYLKIQAKDNSNISAKFLTGKYKVSF